MVPKTSTYSKDFDKAKYMSFLIKHEELLEKYNEIRDKVCNTIKKVFDKEPVYNEKYLRTKIKSCEGKISTNFHEDKIPKEVSQYICLTVTLIDSVLRTGKNYYSEVFLRRM